MAKLVTIYWRDIPAQVNAQSGRQRARLMLPGKFQAAIDQATVASKLFTYHEFVKHWRRTTQDCDGDLTQACKCEADRLTTAYPATRLTQLVLNLGYEN